MTRKRLCYGPLCYEKKIKHDPADMLFFKTGGHLYCHRCYKIIERELDYKKKFYDVLKVMFGNPLPGIIHAQIKRFLKEEMTFEGMYITLRYLVHDQKMTLVPKYGIKLVELDYQEALADYTKTKKRSVPKNFNNKVHHVTITEQALSRKKPILSQIREDDLFD